MDNFMDRLVDRMDGQGRRYEDDMPMDDRDPRYSSPRGRMDYGEPDDFGFGGGYGRQSQPRPQAAPSVGRKDLEELGRAVIEAQKKITDRQGETLDEVSKGVKEGFQKQDETSSKLLSEIQGLKADIKGGVAAKPAAPVAEGPKDDGVTKAFIAQALEQNANDVAAKSADAIHKEDVKLYKNVQAIVEENASRITKAVTAGNAKTAEDLAQVLGSSSQSDKMNELAAAVAETKEELLNRTSGLKAKVTVAMILSIVNFIGVAVLVAIAFGFL
ncbi:MAG: hypothetical protein IJU43_04175 [Lachnospiraceae bacterium]|nr:hypothetical protein [Lachnospiraceae bacterium]